MFVEILITNGFKGASHRNISQNQSKSVQSVYYLFFDILMNQIKEKSLDIDSATPDINSQTLVVRYKTPDVHAETLNVHTETLNVHSETLNVHAETPDVHAETPDVHAPTTYVALIFIKNTSKNKSVLIRKIRVIRVPFQQKTYLQITR